MSGKQNKENRQTNKAFHKSIDLATQKEPQQTQNQPSQFSQQQQQQFSNVNHNQKILSQSQHGNPNTYNQQQQQQQQQINTEESNNKKMMNRQNSFNSIDNNSRRYSLFSKTSFATQNSFLFGTRIFNRTSQQKPVPKVNIQTIFKNKAKMYLDDDLSHNFDELLDKGYEMVSKQKEEKDILKQQELGMIEEIDVLQKEIQPIIQSINTNQDQLAHNLEIKKKYEEQISDLQSEMVQLQQIIEKRVEEITQQHNQFTVNIKDLEVQNNEIRGQININKAEHRQRVNECEKEIKQLNLQQQSLVNDLTEHKKQYEDHKLAQATRLRKMENKCKMFIGILKH